MTDTKILLLVLALIFIFINFLKEPHVITKYKVLKEKKYVMYECTNSLCGGWGDRLKGIMSAYAWSLLTNRIFLINITNPCLLTTFFEPNEIQWNLEHYNLTNLKKEYYYKIDNLHFRQDLDNFNNYVIKNNIFLSS